MGASDVGASEGGGQTDTPPAGAHPLTSMISIKQDNHLRTISIQRGNHLRFEDFFWGVIMKPWGLRNLFSSTDRMRASEVKGRGGRKGKEGGGMGGMERGWNCSGRIY